MAATYQGHAPLAAALVARGADANVQNGSGLTALMLASCTGDVETVQMLLDAGADAMIKDASGNTAMRLAQESDHQQCLRAIAEKATTPPADPDQTPGLTRPPVHLSTRPPAHPPIRAPAHSSR